MLTFLIVTFFLLLTAGGLWLAWWLCGLDESDGVYQVAGAGLVVSPVEGYEPPIFLA